jgi:hypothetical protein
MEIKPGVHPHFVMPAPVPAPLPIAPLPMAPLPMAPMPHHDHVHLHTSYKHTAIVLPEVKPVFHAPVIAPYSSTGAILVLFILLVIITRGLHHFHC